jgi:hypothetical protein
MVRQRRLLRTLFAVLLCSAFVAVLTGCGGSGAALGQQIDDSFQGAIISSLGPGITMQRLVCRQQRSGTYQLAGELPSLTSSELNEDENSELYHCGVTLAEDQGLRDGSVSLLFYLTIKRGGNWTAMWEPAPLVSGDSYLLTPPCTGTLCNLTLSAGTSAAFGAHYTGAPQKGETIPETKGSTNESPTGSPATGEASSQPTRPSLPICGTINLKNQQIGVRVGKGSVSCTEAEEVIRKLYSSPHGHAYSLHHNPPRDLEETYWIIDGWKCFVGAGEGTCTRGATDQISGSLG